MKLTLEEKAKLICELCGHELFVIEKNGYYYRPDAAGYTTSLAEAWKLPEDKARKYEYLPKLKLGDRHYGEQVLIKPAPLMAYFSDLNACHETEKWLRGTEEEYRTVPAIQQRWKSYEQALLQGFGISARSQERAELFGVVMKLWTWDQMDLPWVPLSLLTPVENSTN